MNSDYSFSEAISRTISPQSHFRPQHSWELALHPTCRPARRIFFSTMACPSVSANRGLRWKSTIGAPRPKREGGRSAKAQSHTADVHALEESDRAILSMNQTNKEESSSAEPGEKRARAKENIVQPNTSPTQRGEVCVPRIERCASAAPLAN